jgi:hypothetical protein
MEKGEEWVERDMRDKEKLRLRSIRNDETEKNRNNHFKL